MKNIYIASRLKSKYSSVSGLNIFSGKARIRVQLSAAHSLQDVDRAVDAFISVGKDLKVIP